MEAIFAEITPKTKIATVIGCDTYLGAHMVKHLCQTARMVYGFAQDEEFGLKKTPSMAIGEEKIGIEPIPALSEWLFICLDPQVGFDQYITKIRKILNLCSGENFFGRICLFSSAAICQSEGDPLTEEARVFTRNSADLALATAENFLSTFICDYKNCASMTIVRIGVPYGNEIKDMPAQGFVNRMLADAKKQKSLKIPLTGDAKRSLTHISDICEAVIAVMEAKYCPAFINIPGEEITLREAGSAIANKCNVSFEERGLSQYDDTDFFAEDQHLSSLYFNDTVDFSPRYTFSRWLADQ